MSYQLYVFQTRCIFVSTKLYAV